MGFSPLADMGRRIPDTGRSSPRLSPVSGFTIHHNAGVDAYGQATAAGREVGAQYWITNDGAILPHVDESQRAFTSGMPGYPAGAEADHRNITVEVSNDGGPGWSISTAARDALARLIGDVFRRYELGPVHRGAVGGVAVHRDFVPTECPGPYVMQHLGEIIAEAEQYRTGGAPIPPIHGMENDMIIFYAHALGKGKPGWLILGYTPKPLILSTQASANTWGNRIGKETISTSYDGFRKYLRSAGGSAMQLARVSKGA